MMAIAVPVAGTGLSVSTFGKPVVDSVNSQGYYYHSTMSDTSIASATAVNIAGGSITWPADNSRYYRVSVALEVLGGTTGDVFVVQLAGPSNQRCTQPVLKGGASQSVFFMAILPQLTGSQTLTVTGFRPIGSGTMIAGNQGFICLDDMGNR